jgi:hypothetical protein
MTTHPLDGTHWRLIAYRSGEDWMETPPDVEVTLHIDPRMRVERTPSTRMVAVSRLGGLARTASTARMAGTAQTSARSA